MAASSRCTLSRSNPWRLAVSPTDPARHGWELIPPWGVTEGPSPSAAQFGRLLHTVNRRTLSSRSMWKDMSEVMTATVAVNAKSVGGGRRAQCVYPLV